MDGRKLTAPERRQTPVRNSGPGANPDDQASTDINSLVAQYRKTGTFPNVPLQNPLYDEAVYPGDLQAAYEQIQEAEDTFFNLPSDVRSAADNSAVKFLEMFHDENQRDLLTSAGLLVSRPQEEPPTPDLSPAPPQPAPGTPPAPAPPAPATPPDDTTPAA